MAAQAAEKHVVSEMQTATSADGTNIGYWRQGSGTPLVLVHGALAEGRPGPHAPPGES